MRVLVLLELFEQNLQKQSLEVFYKAAPTTLFKKETLAQMFFCEFFKISKNALFIEHVWGTASRF